MSKSPLSTLRHHVTGAIERGEAVAIAGIPAPANLATLTVETIKSLVSDKAVSKADAAVELTRRIDKRAAAGRHPMPFVIAFRDSLVAA